MAYKKKHKKRRKRDKIFGNDYNEGNIEFEFYDSSVVKSAGESALSANMFTDNSFNSWEREQLGEELYNIFLESDFYEKFSKTKKKKVPKADVFKIYYYFKSNVQKRKYTCVQIFTEICNFMNLNYKNTFDILMPLDKQDIIGELDGEYNIFKKKKTKRLF